MLIVISAPAAIAEDPGHVIVNSADWRDVYSAMQYGTLMGYSTSFLVSDRHATLILNQIPPSNHLWIIQSSRVPYVVGYQNVARSRGYTSEVIELDNVNLGLAEDLDVTSFIIVDDSYGYNAVSVAPYAAVSESYVLFADSDNIAEVMDFLSSREVESLIIYGHVDREVKEILSVYDPEIINNEGDRFLNNIEIVERYQKIHPRAQAILTNGEFVERELMSGLEPVLFIGSANVPQVVRDYVAKSPIEVGVLIGNELVGAATTVKRQLGISVFVKFAQGARAPKGAISQVEALDMYYLPIYSLNIEIESITFNDATSQLEVTLRNLEDQAVYFIGSYSISASDGSRQTVGDADANFLDANELKTIVYDAEPIVEGDISVEAFVIFGESKNSLEKELRKTIIAKRVRILDECEIDVDGINVYLNKRSGMFYVEIDNIGKKDCYVDVELVDINIAGDPVTYGMESVAMIPAGDKKRLRIKSDIEEEDIPDNEMIHVRGFYGERETALVKMFDLTLPMLFVKGDYLFYSLLVVIIILILLILWKRYRDKKKKP